MIYRGNKWSKFCGILSFIFLCLGGITLVSKVHIYDILSKEIISSETPWKIAIIFLVLSIVLAYISYRLAGGKRNPELLKSYWSTKKGNIDVISEPIGEWHDKIKVMFEILEQDANGDYLAALKHLNIKHMPEEVLKAYEQTRSYPTLENWNRLRDVMINYPPEETTS